MPPKSSTHPVDSKSPPEHTLLSAIRSVSASREQGKFGEKNRYAGLTPDQAAIGNGSVPSSTRRSTSTITIGGGKRVRLREAEYDGKRVMGMVIEGIITTENEDGSMHVAPIGPHGNPDLTEWTLKPFQTSHTFARLHATGRGVFHVVDDGLLMIKAVLGLANEPSSRPAATFRPDCGWILADSVRAVPLQIEHWDCSSERAIAQCSAGSWIEVRPFWGWNRARNSLLELAVLLSRRHMLEREVIEQAVAQHRIIIEKTAGPREREALELVLQTLMPPPLSPLP